MRMQLEKAIVDYLTRVELVSGGQHHWIYAVIHLENASWCVTN